MDLYEDEPNDDYESYAMRQRIQPHGGQLMMTTQVTTKVPPGFDGKTSWFAFEDAIDDWCDITELESEKWGPALRNRLEGEASVFKRLLDRDELRQPNGRGVEYFKRTLRPHFVKGAQTVFLYRFMRFMKNNRGNGDLMKWMTVGRTLVPLFRGGTLLERQGQKAANSQASVGLPWPYLGLHAGISRLGISSGRLSCGLASPYVGFDVGFMLVLRRDLWLVGFLGLSLATFLGFMWDL